jgi:hypothetical protein
MPKKRRANVKYVKKSATRIAEEKAARERRSSSRTYDPTHPVPEASGVSGASVLATSSVAVKTPRSIVTTPPTIGQVVQAPFGEPQVPKGRRPAGSIYPSLYTTGSSLPPAPRPSSHNHGVTPSSSREASGTPGASTSPPLHTPTPPFVLPTESYFPPVAPLNPPYNPQPDAPRRRRHNTTNPLDSQPATGTGDGHNPQQSQRSHRLRKDCPLNIRWKKPCTVSYTDPIQPFIPVKEPGYRQQIEKMEIFDRHGELVTEEPRVLGDDEVLQEADRLLGSLRCLGVTEGREYDDTEDSGNGGDYVVETDCTTDYTTDYATDCYVAETTGDEEEVELDEGVNPLAHLRRMTADSTVTSQKEFERRLEEIEADETSATAPTAPVASVAPVVSKTVSDPAQAATNEDDILAEADGILDRFEMEQQDAAEESQQSEEEEDNIQAEQDNSLRARMTGLELSQAAFEARSPSPTYSSPPAIPSSPVVPSSPRAMTQLASVFAEVEDLDYIFPSVGNTPPTEESDGYDPEQLEYNSDKDQNKDADADKYDDADAEDSEDDIPLVQLQQCRRSKLTPMARGVEFMDVAPELNLQPAAEEKEGSVASVDPFGYHAEEIQQETTEIDPEAENEADIPDGVSVASVDSYGYQLYGSDNKENEIDMADSSDSFGYRLYDDDGQNEQDSDVSDLDISGSGPGLDRLFTPDTDVVPMDIDGDSEVSPEVEAPALVVANSSPARSLRSTDVMNATLVNLVSIEYGMGSRNDVDLERVSFVLFFAFLNLRNLIFDRLFQHHGGLQDQAHIWL